MKSDVRSAGINLNHWYVAVRSTELLRGQIVGLTLWNQPIALYRNSEGGIRAMEDRCPHRQVKLSHGQIHGDSLECAYHGWRFDAEGKCNHVPYLQERQRLPSCHLRTYPVQERYGFLWVFPGDPDLASEIPALEIPEWDHLDHISSVAIIDAKAHFSFVIENLMDMHHGHLHDKYQAWSDASLQHLESSEGRVEAFYQAQSYHRVETILSMAQIFIPPLRKISTQPLNVRYIYPHWTSELGDDFKLYCLFSPAGPSHTKAYLIHFTSLKAFTGLQKLPVPFRRWVKNSMFNVVAGLLNNLIVQDVRMIEEEQAAHLSHPERASIELNRTLVSVQRLITSQSAQPIQSNPPESMQARESLSGKT